MKSTLKTESKFVFIATFLYLSFPKRILSIFVIGPISLFFPTCCGGNDGLIFRSSAWLKISTISVPFFDEPTISQFKVKCVARLPSLAPPPFLVDWRGQSWATHCMLLEGKRGWYCAVFFNQGPLNGFHAWDFSLFCIF